MQSTHGIGIVAGEVNMVVAPYSCWLCLGFLRCIMTALNYVHSVMFIA